MKPRRSSELAIALRALKNQQDFGVGNVFHGCDVLGAVNTRVLLQNGFLEHVIKGWYIVSSPAHAGTTVSWFASYWSFVAAYCNSRFGEDWCLTPEESISVLCGATVIPRQVIVRVRKGSNSIQKLLHETSILNITASLPVRMEKDPTYGLNVYPIPEALLRCSADFYLNHPKETRACLAALAANDALETSVQSVSEAAVGRLIGALRAIGRTDVAETILARMKTAGRRIVVSNPFERAHEPIRPLERSPIAARLRLLWADMRTRILPHLAHDAPSPTVRPLQEILKDIDDGYVADSYHSLSIEGYRVSEDLIRRIAGGDWHPDSPTDQDHRDALAASGYYRAYRKVRASIEAIVKGADPAETIAADIVNWHRELFQPCVEAGLLRESDLLGYRRGQVYIASSRYTPPPASALPDAMAAFFDLLLSEQDYRVRALLGHFFFVHIHPYADGNGRTARFIMNATLVSGGGRWIVIPVEMRNRYMQSLETANVSGNIEDFAAFINSLCPPPGGTPVSKGVATQLPFSGSTQSSQRF